MLWEHLEDFATIFVAQLRKSFVRESSMVIVPLTANMGLGGHNVPFVKDSYGLRRLTERECFGTPRFSR